MNAKKWFRENIKQYLSISDEKTTAKIETAKTELRQEMSSVSVTGTFKGSFATVSAMPSRAKNGDWSVLTADDGSNESGIYAKSAQGWAFIMDIATFGEVQAVLATDSEFQAGTATDKAVTVKQFADSFQGTITAEEVKEDWESLK